MNIIYYMNQELETDKKGTTMEDKFTMWKTKENEPCSCVFILKKKHHNYVELTYMNVISPVYELSTHVHPSPVKHSRGWVGKFQHKELN